MKCIHLPPAPDAASKLGPAFYNGYNDTINCPGFIPITGLFEPGIEQNSRTFLIRASNLHRKSF